MHHTPADAKYAKGYICPRAPLPPKRKICEGLQLSTSSALLMRDMRGATVATPADAK